MMVKRSLKSVFTIAVWVQLSKCIYIFNAIEAAKTVALTVPYGTDVTSLVPTITHTGVSVSPASGVPQDFTNPVTYTVTAENSTTQTYTVTVTVALNPAKAITAFSFNGLTPNVIGTVNEAAKTVALTVPYGTDVTALVPTITHTGASVSPNTGVTQNFTNPVIYTVTAEDGSTQIYTVTVTVAAEEPIIDPPVQPVTPSTPSTPSNSVVVVVNGEKQDAAESSTLTTNGSTTTTITVDDAKLSSILEKAGENAVVSLQTGENSGEVVVGQLTGQTVKNMESKNAVLEIKTENATYTLPASQIDIDTVSRQFGTQVELKDIQVNVKIAEPSADTVKIVEDAANAGSYQLVVKPIEFEITCTSGNQTVTVSKFDSYVERMIMIPVGVDPAKITTGVVLNEDGTFRHVPTQIVQIGDVYYAKISSLTNSTYTVVYYPVTFTDAIDHWAKDAITDMGSRLVITGVGNNSYEPERSITRAEFTAIIVRALGLAKGTVKSVYDDVTLTDWFNGYVATATAYGLITGYDDTHFGPNDMITREQAMTILARTMKLTGLSSSLSDYEVSALFANYTDADKVSDFAKAGVAACIKTGVVTGTSTTTLSPKEYVTRAEVAVMVQRLLKKSGLI